MSVLIDAPVPGAAAFDGNSKKLLWSQAAQIIGIGLQLSGHSGILHSAEEEVKELEIPRIPPLEWKSTLEAAHDFTVHRRMLDIRSMLQYQPRPSIVINAWERAGWRGADRPMRRYAISRITDLTNGGWEMLHKTGSSIHLKYLRELWSICAAEEDSRAAAAFLQVGLRSPFVIIRTTSAVQLSWVDRDVTKEVIMSLLEGCSSKHSTISQMSLNALYRINAAHPLIRQASSPPGRSFVDGRAVDEQQERGGSA